MFLALLKFKTTYAPFYIKKTTFLTLFIDNEKRERGRNEIEGEKIAYGIWLHREWNWSQPILYNSKFNFHSLFNFKLHKGYNEDYFHDMKFAHSCISLTLLVLGFGLVEE